MVDRHAGLFHDLFQVPVAQRVGHVPSDAGQGGVDRGTHSFDDKHGRSSADFGVKVCTFPTTTPLTRQNQVRHQPVVLFVSAIIGRHQFSDSTRVPTARLGYGKGRQTRQPGAARMRRVAPALYRLFGRCARQLAATAAARHKELRRTPSMSQFLRWKA